MISSTPPDRLGTVTFRFLGAAGISAMVVVLFAILTVATGNAVVYFIGALFTAVTVLLMLTTVILFAIMGARTVRRRHKLARDYVQREVP